MINNQKYEVETGQFLNESLNQFTVQELITMAEKFSASSLGESFVMKKIFEQIEREKNENEYSRTEVIERAEDLNKARMKNKINLN